MVQQMKPKISLVTLGVANVERAKHFYGAGLGFQSHNYSAGDDCVFFKLEGSWLSIYPRDKLATDAGVDATGSGFSGIALTHNVASKAEVDGVLQHAAAAGARIVKSGQDAAWGGYSGYFADPDGHLWEVAWNPFTDLT